MMYSQLQNVSDPRFNRYMVECEFRKVKLILRLSVVLIDTWWNVNSIKRVVIKDIPGFNRYMVECEFALAVTSVSS